MGFPMAVHYHCDADNNKRLHCMVAKKLTKAKSTSINKLGSIEDCLVALGPISPGLVPLSALLGLPPLHVTNVLINLCELGLMGHRWTLSRFVVYQKPGSIESSRAPFMKS